MMTAIHDSKEAGAGTECKPWTQAGAMVEYGHLEIGSRE
jgi:hypothetical protein